MNKNKVVATLRSVARNLGLKITLQKGGMPQFSYDGNAHIRMWNTVDTSDLAHEISHWIVATPKERQLVEFGLGNSPFGLEKGYKTVSRPEADAAERLASLYGIMLQRTIGDDTWKSTWYDHGWDRGPYLSTCTDYNTLLNRGHIDSGGMCVVASAWAIPRSPFLEEDVCVRSQKLKYG